MKLNITRGGQPAAPKLYVYGREGIGKTTFTAGCPKPLIIDIDGGAERYKADILKVSSVNELLDALSEVRKTSYTEVDDGHEELPR